MSEDELYGVFVRAGFFEELGYGRFGVDVKPQYVVPGERKKADYVCRDEYQNVIFVLEAKKPRDERLEDALGQLWERYVLPLKAVYGVLTNGRRFVVYKRVGISAEPLLDFSLTSASEADCNQLYCFLKKREYDVTLHSRVQEYFAKVEKLSLKTDLAKENFFETFKLNVDSIFGKLVYDLMKLFDWVHSRSKFLKGAYGFWRKSFATEPEKIPDSWKAFLKGDGDVFKFMFCLESAHTLLARLILAKACEDLKFPSIGISNFVVQKIHQFRGQVPLVGYPIVLLKLLKEMKDQLVSSIFEEDIFSWWSDAFASLSEMSSGELMQEKVPEELEDFSETVARLLFILYKYDFSEVAGDPLGDLYQQYFDKETRKALGEFYTPVEIVNYILDAVEYKYVRHKRLLDPACGSGTFLVEALKRYLREMEPVAKENGWAFVLKELCNSPRIVGFDIHPFACLIAQVRFMLELIPYYKKAVEEERFEVYASLQRLPIFRTDSLAIEMRPEGLQLGPKLLVTEEDIRFSVSLPMKADGEETIAVKVMIPSWKKTSAGTEYNLFNLDEYFCVTQAVFDAVKAMVRAEAEEVPTKGLEACIKKYLTNKDFHVIAKFFKPYADQILNEIRHIQSKFEDGRLIKSIEDAILAALLKNYVRYDFVVGNPPYVRIQLLPKENVEHYRRTFKSAFGKFDLYFLFLERGVRWLEKGKLGYICSNKFMQVSSAANLREFIVGNCQIQQIIDFGDSGVFQDVTNYPCIIILNSTKVNASGIIRCVRVIKPKEKLLPEVAEHIKERSYSDGAYDVFEYSQHELGKEIWKLMPKAEKDVFEKISRNADVKLKKVAERIFTGIQSGADKIYVIGEKTQHYPPIEKTLLKPFLKGEDIRRWRVHWRRLYILYPNRKVGDKVAAIEQGEMSQNFPISLKWFMEHKSKLDKRIWYGRTAKEMYGQWYSLMYAGDPEWYEQPKIVTPALANENSFALDVDGYYFPCGTAGGYGIAIKEEYKESLLYFLGLLNSKLLEYYIKKISPMFSGGYYKYSADYLEQLPIKMPSTLKEKKLADQITKITQKIILLMNPQELIKGFPETIIHEYSQKGIEFDTVTHTFEDNHAELEPFLTEQPDKGYAVYPNKGEKPIWAETEEKAQYIVLALKKKNAKKNDTVKILIPRDNSVVEKILHDYKMKLKELEKTSLEQLEKEINEHVYHLYGLDEHDKTVIQDFLQKF
jgi:type I restriction-modification system DNA methylase subunit